MAHMIEMVGDKASVAFLGSRDDIWHRLGQQMEPGQSIETWAEAAGLNWEALTVPAFAHFNGRQVEDKGNKFIVRSNNDHILGYVSNRYKVVQPAEILEWFQQYISVDDRFQLDVAGCLKQGEIVWATAKYNGDMSIGGDNHVARVLMTTTFDGTGATINQATMTRVVCNNTLKASLAGKGGMVKTRHNTKFVAERVSEELGNIAQGIAAFKDMGDAMAKVHFSKAETEALFKKLLKFPEDESEMKNNTKRNQLEALWGAYLKTVDEGTVKDTKWTALNAVTRYVDHEMRTWGNGDEEKFVSAQFGPGAKLKEQAVELLNA